MSTSRLTEQDIEAANSAAQELAYWTSTLINAAHGRAEPPLSLLAPEAQAEFFDQILKQLLANVDRHAPRIEQVLPTLALAGAAGGVLIGYPGVCLYRAIARLAQRVQRSTNIAAAVIALKGGDPEKLRWADVAGQVREDLPQWVDWEAVRERLAEEAELLKAANEKQSGAESANDDAFVPASCFVDPEFLPDHKAVARAIEKYGISHRKPSRNRLEVHAAQMAKLKKDLRDKAEQDREAVSKATKPSWNRQE